jgi:hypothetical protein
VGEGFGGRRSPRFDPLLHSPRCAGSVTGNLQDTTTPAPDPSPVVLRMLFMHSSTGLAIQAEIVVLCRFWKGDGARSPALPQRRVNRVAANRGRGHVDGPQSTRSPASPIARSAAPPTPATPVSAT